MIGLYYTIPLIYLYFIVVNIQCNIINMTSVHRHYSEYTVNMTKFLVMIK